MRSPAAERALRRLVARLAAAAPGDIELVLEALEPEQRDEVRTLLADFDPGRLAGPAPEDQGRPQPAPPPADPQPSVEPDLTHLIGLSPWLSGQVLTSAAPGAASDICMTPLARAALAEEALKLPPAAPGLGLPLAAPRRRRGPLAWLGGGA